jgi:hypothetical protein
MYIVAVQDLSSGFRRAPKVKIFENLNEAFPQFNKLAYEARFDFPDVTPQVIMYGGLKTSVFYYEEKKGNGRFVILAKDDYMLATIQNEVDSRAHTQRRIAIEPSSVRYEKVQLYKFSAEPVVQLREKEYGTLQYILRSDDEDGDAVYDVYFRKTDGTVYCENLNEVSLEALIGIYLEM